MPASTAAKTLRAAIYARRSKKSDGGGNSRSVDEQISECRLEVADHPDWDLVDTFTDNNISASRYTNSIRPGWQRLKAAIEAREIDLVVTWEHSRATRDLMEFAILVELLIANGVLWHYDGQTYDMTNPSDINRATADAGNSIQESARLSKRLLRATNAQALAGKPHGKPVYGYIRDYDPATRQLVSQHPDPAVWPTLREIVDRFLAGESARTIAADLNTRNVPSPAGAKWHLSQIRRVLTMPTYRGRRLHRGEDLGPGSANWEALITEDEADLIDVRMDDPARRRSASRSDVKYLLTGVARCGKCASKMYRQPGKGGKDTLICREGRGHLTRNMAPVDAYVTGLILTRLSQPDALRALTAGAEDTTATEARQEAAELRARLTDATDAFTRGELTATTLGRIEADLLGQIAAADQRTRAAAGLPQSIVALTESGADGIDAAWDALTVEQKREAVRTLVNVTILPAGKGKRTFNAALIDVEWRS